MGARFKDNVAIVTGGCQGIGRGCADELVEHGGKVVVFDIKDDLGRQFETDVGNDPTIEGEVHFIHCDLTNEDDITSGIQRTVDRFGGIDLLVNNAGWHPPSLTIDDFSADDFRSLLNLNLVGYFLTCKYALPHLRKTKGNIVNIGSLSGQMGHRLQVTYSTTKDAIIGLTKALAIDESLHGVRVNAISPGYIYTPLMDEYARNMPDPSIIKEFTRYNHMQRFGTPREVGKACLYLATDANYSTGIEMNVSGGLDLGFGPKES